MTIYTTYLAKLKNDPEIPMRIGSCFVYVVTTRAKKENRCVAPEWSFLDTYKKETDCDACNLREIHEDNTCDQCHEDAWAKYEKFYLDRIRISPIAQEWIQKRSEEAIIQGNILLVCYEKDPRWCHRRLLAEEISRLANPNVNFKHAEYKGEFLG